MNTAKFVFFILLHNDQAGFKGVNYVCLNHWFWTCVNWPETFYHHNKKKGLLMFNKAWSSGFNENKSCKYHSVNSLGKVDNKVNKHDVKQIQM